MINYDKRGLAVSARKPEAVLLFDQALDDMLEYRARTAQSIQNAINAEPEFVLPHVLMTGALLLMGTNSVRPQIDLKLAELDKLAEQSADIWTARERGHVDALRAWAAGDLARASRLWESIIHTTPHDLLALRSLHFQNFWMGRATYMRNMVGAALASWDETVPGYAFVLGMAAFGFEECGDYGRAERLGREAVARNADDLWSVHAVGHVLEMQGRLAEGMSWLDGPDDRWADRGPFKSHLWWHASLFAVERMAYDRALALYDAHIRPGEKFVSTDMMNAPSLLARLEFQGVDVGHRWDELAARSIDWVDDHVVAFTDAHTMFPLARTGRPEAEQFLNSLEQFANKPDDYAASISGALLLPLAQAVQAYYLGNFERTIELLMPIRADLQPIGGSHAQRDLFHQLLTEAAIKAGQSHIARTLLNERIAMRPDNPLNNQKLQALNAEAALTLQ